MSKEILDNLSEKLNQKFPGEIISSELHYDFATITVNHHKVHDILRFLKEDTELNFHFLTDLTGMQTADENHLGVIYHLHNMPKNIRVRVKAFFDILLQL